MVFHNQPENQIRMVNNPWTCNQRFYSRLPNSYVYLCSQLFCLYFPNQTLQKQNLTFNLDCFSFVNLLLWKILLINLLVVFSSSFLLMIIIIKSNLQLLYWHSCDLQRLNYGLSNVYDFFYYIRPLKWISCCEAERIQKQ